MKRVISVIMIMILSFNLIGCKKEASNDEGKIGYEIGNIAYDIKIENTDGETVSLSDFRGKAVYILAWAST